jgi:hypothetical protein
VRTSWIGAFNEFSKSYISCSDTWFLSVYYKHHTSRPQPGRTGCTYTMSMGLRFKSRVVCTLLRWVFGRDRMQAVMEKSTEHYGRCVYEYFNRGLHRE